MRSVGLHFGHDAGVGSMSADGLDGFLSKERRIRVKHALGLSTEDVLPFLAKDAVIGLSSTQNVPMFSPAELRTEVDGALSIGAVEYFGYTENQHFAKLASWITNKSHWSGPLVRDSTFYLSDRKIRYPSYEALASVDHAHPNQHARTRRPAHLSIGEATWHGWFYEHHFLHALYAAHALSSGMNALVVTSDGAAGPSGGGVYHWRPGQRLKFVCIADAWVGAFYDEVARQVGLGRIGGAGKLMGLAPYGHPKYFKPELVGTYAQVSDNYRRPVSKIVANWLENLTIPPWDKFMAVPPEIIADIASSAQLVVELNRRYLLQAAACSAERMGFEHEAIVLSGGVALNCPSNSSLAMNHNKPILIPPGLNDEGLAIGAATAAYFDAYNHYPPAPKNFAQAVYIGTEVSGHDIAVVAKRRGWRHAGDIKDACKILMSGEPLGLCFGRSELGPRALGHRSILVSPILKNAWSNTNTLKGREPWRPFAPAVLKEAAEQYFDCGPNESRYMLFTYQCKTSHLPAVTHVDGSARVQHVSPETGLLYALLCQLQKMGHPPVLLNTSFNGADVPIVDSADDTFEEAEKLGLYNIFTEVGLFISPARC